jgi:DNA (cytosine-5)-methyltransferase 1
MVDAVYNEIEPFLAKWLDNLISYNHIADGHIVCKSIKEIDTTIFKDYNQAHFFAGVGGWSYALRLVGWPDDRKVWTISCPCPPWSRARINNLDFDKTRDERDLWPVVMPIIKQHMPSEIYGEQVAGKKVQEWILRTRKDLESIGYNFEGRTTKSSYAGAPSQRERFFFFAHLDSQRGQRLVKSVYTSKTRPWRWGSEKDLRTIVNSPFQPGDSWPQPLIRSGDDGVPNRVAVLRAYGNAIDPWQAAQFIFETQTGINSGFFLRTK